MKSLIIILFLSITMGVSAQVTEKGKIKIEELPGVVIKRVGKDFSVYIPDNNPDKIVKTPYQYKLFDVFYIFHF